LRSSQCRGRQQGGVHKGREAEEREGRRKAGGGRGAREVEEGEEEEGRMRRRGRRDDDDDDARFDVSNTTARDGEGRKGNSGRVVVVEW